MIRQILIAKRYAVDPLLDEIRDRVLDTPWIAVIVEAEGKLLEDPRPLLDFSQQ